MKEPLRDAFFQPANHPYFVKEKSFWTIERAGIQKRSDVIGVPSATASDSLCTSYRASDNGSRTGSVSLSLQPAASSSSQLASAHDSAAIALAVAALACPTEQCCANPRLAIRKTASVQPEKGSSSVGLGDGCCFPAPPGVPVSSRGSGIVINAATCPNLCRHASFLTDSLNRRNLLGGYFDADYEDGTLGRDVPAGSSRRRRPRRRSDSLRRDSGSVDSSLGCEQPNVGLASDRPAGGGRRQCTATASVTSAVATEVTSAESGSLQLCAATAAELSAVTSAATAVVSAETDATATSVSDCQDICSICSSSSDGSGNAADVIQPVALKLHLADEVRGDVTKLATSLTRRLFFARGPKHEDVPATQSAALYHRDSDRSHLDVRSQPISHAAEVQRSASVSRCSMSASLAVVQDGVPALSKEQRRASGHTVQASVQLHSKPSDLQPSSRGDACGSVTSAGRRLQRSADRASPWVTSASSRVSLELQASAETRFGRNVPRDMVSGSSSSMSSSDGGLFTTTVEQLNVDDSTGRGERHERKQRRCRRRCCRAVTICVVLAVIGAVVAAVSTLHFEGQLTSSPIARNTPAFDSSAAVTATTMSPSKSITVTFVGALRLMMEFLPEMADINSTASRNLSKQFCAAVDRIYYNNSDSLVYDPLYGCQVTNLSSGSIKMNFRVSFVVIVPTSIENSSTSTVISDMVKSIVNKLREYIQGNVFDGLLWDKDFFEMYEVHDGRMSPTKSAPSETHSAHTSESTTYVPTVLPSNELSQPDNGEITAVRQLFTTSEHTEITTAAVDPWPSSAETAATILHAPVTSILPSSSALTSSADSWPTFSTYSPVDRFLPSSWRASSTAVGTLHQQPSSPAATSTRAALQQLQTAGAAADGNSSAAAPGSALGTTESPRRSPCYNPGATSGGLRLVADPLNCRAFYVCGGNGSSIVVHMNCTLHSSYSYYDAARKTCELCDVTKCDQCAGLQPRTKIVLPLLLMLLGRTSSTATSSTPTTALIGTVASSATCTADLSGDENCSSQSGGMSGAVTAAVADTSLNDSGSGMPSRTAASIATESAKAADASTPSSSLPGYAYAAAAAPTARQAFAATPKNAESFIGATQFVQFTGSAVPDLEQPLLPHRGDRDRSDSTAVAAFSATSAVIDTSFRVAVASQPALVASEPLPVNRLPIAEASWASSAAAAETPTTDVTVAVIAVDDAFTRTLPLPPSAASSGLYSTADGSGSREGHSLWWQSQSGWSSLSAPTAREATEEEQSGLARPSSTAGVTSPVVHLSASRASRQFDDVASATSASILSVTLATLSEARDSGGFSNGDSGSSFEWSGKSSNRLCSGVALGRSNTLSGIVADPDDCTRYAYCFTNGAAVGWQCECGQMYVAEASECRTCDPSACDHCRPCHSG